MPYPGTKLEEQCPLSRQLRRKWNNKFSNVPLNPQEWPHRHVMLDTTHLHRLYYVKKYQYCTSRAWLQSGYRSEFGLSVRGHNTQTEKASCTRASVVLPPSKHQSALTSGPQPAECCCGRRKPRRPGCCRETHRSLHTHEALKTFSEVAEEKKKQEQKRLSVTRHLPAVKLLR